MIPDNQNIAVVKDLIKLAKSLLTADSDDNNKFKKLKNKNINII